jgi:hypothetical protein
VSQRVAEVVSLKKFSHFRKPTASKEVKNREKSVVSSEPSIMVSEEEDEDDDELKTESEEPKDTKKRDFFVINLRLSSGEIIQKTIKNDGKSSSLKSSIEGMVKGINYPKRLFCPQTWRNSHLNWQTICLN